MLQSVKNPLGTDGFEFIEFATQDTHTLDKTLKLLGFSKIARHRSKDVVLYRQGNINFIVNHEAGSFAQSFARVHGPSVCAFGLRVKNASEAYQACVKNGAKSYHGDIGPMELNLPSIYGIGDSLLYFNDRYHEHSIYDVDFRLNLEEHQLDKEPQPIEEPQPDEQSQLDKSQWQVKGQGLLEIDHITHNVHSGRMDSWSEFYHKLFNFSEIRYFDIHGIKTGLRSRAMVSPCGKIRIPINEPSDNKSQIQEYLDAYHGEGIQHIALSTDDIYTTVSQLRAQGLKFMSVPDSYYDMLDERVPGHEEDVSLLHENKILIDGAPQMGKGILLQLFTEIMIGPIFFEIIQRKGNDGFGEGNFQALFEAMEQDQMKRGVI